MKRKAILFTLLGLMVVFLAGQVGAQKPGGTLVVALESEVGILDPHLTQGWVTYRVNHEIYDCLVHEDLSTNKMPIPLVPGLATKWEVSNDGLTYTFTLREGVKFHDGTPFNAEAVEFNLRRCTDPNFQYYYSRADANTKKLYGLIKDIKIISPYKIQLAFKEPYHSFIRLDASITMGSGGIVSPEAVKKYGNEGIANHPVGTGPFVFVERVRGEKIVLKRNPDYWGDKAKVERVIFRPMEEAASRINALETGEADIICVPPPDSIESMVKKGYVLSKGPVPHVWYLSFNNKNDIMKNAKVRQAINFAIDREAISKSLLKDTAMPAYGLLVPGDPSFDPNFKPYPYNIEQAKKLLAEAGYPNGFETTLQTSVGGSGQIMPVAIAEWIQRDLGKVGIKVKLDTFEWITYLGVWLKGMTPEVGMNQMSWGFTAPFLLNLIAQTQWFSPVGLNSGYYSNKEVDEWILKAEQAKSDEEYQKYYKMVHEQVMKDAAYAPIVHDLSPYLMNKKVKGFVHAPEDWFSCVPISIGD
jgi:peptide/nickel transport system substrate-binding protein